MPIRAVTLDAGGTLLREEPSRSRIYAEAARRRGLEVTDEAMRRLMHRTHEGLPLELNGEFRYSDTWFRAFMDRIFCGSLGLAPPRLGELQDELFDRFTDPSTFRLFAGARELIVRLRQRGLRVGVVSNWSPRLLPVLEGLGLADLLDGIWASALERVEKPDPEIFLRACRGLNVEPCAALHAGDHAQKDAAGARAAGLRAVLVDHGGTSSPARGSVCRVHGLLDLLPCLEDPCHDAC